MHHDLYGENNEAEENLVLLRWIDLGACWRDADRMQEQPSNPDSSQ